MKVSVPKEEQKTGFELAQAGTYTARIDKLEQKKGPKGQYVELTMKLQGVEFNADGQPIKGSVGNVYDNCTLIEGKRWRMGQVAIAAGLDAEDFDTDELQGAEVQVVIDIEKDSGYSARNVVKKYLGQ